MDAIALLKQDHAVIQKLFKRYETLKHRGDTEKKQEIARRVILELSIHAAIEEQIFYPSVKVHDSRWVARIDKALEEHRVAKWELAALQKMDPRDSRFDARFAVLVQNMLHHIEEEENELFPSLRRAFAQEELDSMADALALAKRAVPTRPHPRLPDEPPGNLVMPLVAVVDRSRDLVTELVERGLAWVRQLAQDGRERTQDLEMEARRWTYEAPGQALKASSDMLEETQDVARDATRRARRVAEDAANDVANRVAEVVEGEPRRKASGTRRSTTARVGRLQGSVTLQTSPAAGRTARQRSGGKSSKASKRTSSQAKASKRS
ncbi:hemerythrin domain-containing protein [Archangium violaceum]|uniref:hemerythrin domain-containing protein n=1 Tax=Archangium violaceum TaxID=83451 RepID=UPI00193B8B7B|nr:hemerythrin domain-containing protein [Archangium violaceum]QRK09375.1 hemerythrin domain-containing protein [Archangium violaceum]